MKYLIYISAASHLMDAAELLEILQVSRSNNTRRQLTGMLLYSEGTFIQYLEGEEEALHTTYQAILSDARHKNIIKMVEGERSEKLFPEWSMGFKSASAEELKEFEGYVNPRGRGFLESADVEPVLNMLKTFASNNRM